MDLKAELYRKQEQFKKEKLGQENAGAGFLPKPKDKVPEFQLWDFIYSVQVRLEVANPRACSSVEAKYLD